LVEATDWARAEYYAIDDGLVGSTSEIDFSEYSSDFKTANAYYKAGDYESAKSAYESILYDCPVHLGARNNYVLALAQCEEYKDSLKNSILLGLIHPEYEGNLVNILIPLYALGYTADNYTVDLEFAGGSAFRGVYDEYYKYDDENYDRAHLYNWIYAEMEGELTDQDISFLQTVLESLKGTYPEETDYSGLLAYFEALRKIR
jgi:hypothetical protein